MPYLIFALINVGSYFVQGVDVWLNNPRLYCQRDRDGLSRGWSSA